MTEPKRWIEDDDAPPELRSLLREAPRARAIDVETRTRVGKHVAKLSIVPVSLAATLGVKTAAAIGMGVGLASVGASVAVVEYLKPGEDLPSPRAAVSAARQRGLPARAPAPSGPAPAASAPAPASTVADATALAEAPRAGRAPSPGPLVSSAGGLAEESTFLEAARRALSSAPERALSLSREHRARFPRPKLASERDLIELEALQRLGRAAEAQSLARRLLAQGGDDLYRARIRQLLSRAGGAR